MVQRYEGRLVVESLVIKEVNFRLNTPKDSEPVRALKVAGVCEEQSLDFQEMCCQQCQLNEDIIKKHSKVFHLKKTVRGVNTDRRFFLWWQKAKSAL